MAISYVGKGTVASGTGNLTLTVPSGVQEDDLLFIYVECHSGDTLSLISGWTWQEDQPKKSSTNTQNDRTQGGLMYKWASASESSATLTFSGDHAIGIMTAFRGVDKTTPFYYDYWDIGPTNSTTSNMSVTYISNPVPADTMWAAWSGFGDDVTVTNISMSSLPGTITTAYDENTTTGNDGTIHMFYSPITSSSTLTTGTMTISASEEHTRFKLIMNPAADNEKTGTATLSGTGTVSASQEGDHEGTAAASGTGTVGHAALPNRSNSVSISGTGTVTADGYAPELHDGTATLSGTGTVSVTGQKNVLSGGQTQWDVGYNWPTTWTTSSEAEVSGGKGRFTAATSGKYIRPPADSKGRAFKPNMRYRVTYTIDSISDPGGISWSDADGDTGLVRTTTGTHEEVVTSDSDAWVQLRVRDYTTTAVVDDFKIEPLIGVASIGTVTATGQKHSFSGNNTQYDSTFDRPDDWTTSGGATVSGGKARFNDSISGSSIRPPQTNNFAAFREGMKYRIVFTIDSISGSGGVSWSERLGRYGTAYFETGTHEDIYTSDTDTWVQLWARNLPVTAVMDNFFIYPLIEVAGVGTVTASGAGSHQGSDSVTGSATVTTAPSKAIDAIMAERGPDLFVNGDLATGDLTGWQTQGAGVSYDAGRLKIGDVGGVDGYAGQNFPTAVGARYEIIWDWVDRSIVSTTALRLRVGSNFGGNHVLDYLFGNLDFGTLSRQFEATVTQTYVTFLGSNTNNYGIIDNISMRVVGVHGSGTVSASGSKGAKSVLLEEGPNLILNGNFATGDGTNWSPYGSGTSQYDSASTGWEIADVAGADAGLYQRADGTISGVTYMLRFEKVSATSPVNSTARTRLGNTGSNSDTIGDYFWGDLDDGTLEHTFAAIDSHTDVSFLASRTDEGAVFDDVEVRRAATINAVCTITTSADITWTIWGQRGDNLVSNGYFHEDISDWVDASTPPSELLWDDGRLHIKADGQTARARHQVFASAPATARYFVRIKMASDSTAHTSFSLGSTAGGGEYLVQDANIGENFYSCIVPSGQALWLNFYRGGTEDNYIEVAEVQIEAPGVQILSSGYVRANGETNRNGSASLISVGSVAHSALANRSDSVSISSTGTVTVAKTANHIGSATISGTGTVTVVMDRDDENYSGSAEVFGTGTVTVTGRHAATGTADVSSVSGVDIEYSRPVDNYNGTAEVSGTGSVSVTTDHVTDQYLRVSMENPSGNLVTGADQQVFRVQVRRHAGGSGGSPTVDIWLYENGAAKSKLVDAEVVTSDTSQIIWAYWDASLLDSVAGAAVEVYVYAHHDSANARMVDIGTIEWPAKVGDTPSYTGTATISSTGTVTAEGSGRQDEVGTAAVTGTATVTSSGVKGGVVSVSIDEIFDVFVETQVTGYFPEGTATISGESSNSASGYKNTMTYATVTSVATVTAKLEKIEPRQVTIPVDSLLTVETTHGHTVTLSISGSGTVTASGQTDEQHSGIATVSGTGVVTGSGTTHRQEPATVTGTGSVTATPGKNIENTISISSIVSVSADYTFTEFFTATASVSGVGTVSASTAILAEGIASVTGSGDVQLNVTANRESATSISATGSVSCAGTKTVEVDVTVSGVGDISVTPAAQEPHAGLAAISGSGSVTATSRISYEGSGSITGEGSLSAIESKGGTGTASITGETFVSAAKLGEEKHVGSLQIHATGSVSAVAVKRWFATASVEPSTGTVTASGYKIGQVTFRVQVESALNATGEPQKSAQAAVQGSTYASASGVLSESRSGSAALSGVASVATEALNTRYGVAAHQEFAEIYVFATSDRYVTASVTSSGDVTATGVALDPRSGTASVSGTGQIIIDRNTGHAGTAQITSTGSVNVGGRKYKEQAVSIATSASVDATGSKGFADSLHIYGVYTTTASGSKWIERSAAPITATGSVTAQGRASQEGSGTIDGVAEVTVESRRTSSGSLAISGTPEITVVGRSYRWNAAATSATASIQTTSISSRYQDAAISSFGTVTVSGAAGVSVTSQISGVTEVTVSTLATHNAALAISGSASVSATAGKTYKTAISISGFSGVSVSYQTNEIHSSRFRIEGVTEISASGDKQGLVAVTIAGTSSVNAQYEHSRLAQSTVTGSALVDAAGATEGAAASITGTGLVTVLGSNFQLRYGTAQISTTATLTVSYEVAGARVQLPPQEVCTFGLVDIYEAEGTTSRQIEATATYSKTVTADGKVDRC